MSREGPAEGGACTVMMRREAAVRAHRVGGLAVDEEHEDNDPNVHLRLRQHRPLLLGLLVRRDVLLHWVVLARLGIRLTNVPQVHYPVIQSLAPGCLAAQ